jgi:hypothetical protein
VPDCRGGLGAIRHDVTVKARLNEAQRVQTLSRIGGNLVAVFMGAAALAAVLLAIAGVGFYWDLYLREHEEYYNSYAKRWGVLEGVGRVRAEDAAHRSRTLRFVRKGRLGPIIRVDAIDGSGVSARAGLQDPLAGAQTLFDWDDPTRPCRDRERNSGEVIIRKRELKYARHNSPKCDAFRFRSSRDIVLELPVCGKRGIARLQLLSDVFTQVVRSGRTARNHHAISSLRIIEILKSRRHRSLNETGDVRSFPRLVHRCPALGSRF